MNMDNGKQRIRRNPAEDESRDSRSASDGSLQTGLNAQASLEAAEQAIANALSHDSSTLLEDFRQEGGE